MGAQYNFKEVEENIIKFWESCAIAEKCREKNKGGKKFYFLQGPPYTSGRLHIGHAWNNSMKDIILRYKRMKNLDVWDRAGYDMHGLPTENKVQKKFELKTKDDIIKFGMEKFILECKKFSEDNAKLMDADLFRLGVWMDYENAYWPIKNSFIEGEWLLIKRAHESNRLYKGKKVMTWCKDCETALAKHELEYENTTDNSIFLKFKIAGTDNEYLIIWTTTPWTIPYNMGVMANPEVDYIKAKVENELWIVAKPLAGPLIGGVIDKQFEVVEEFKGEKLEGKKYIHPLHDSIPFNEVRSEKIHTVMLSEEYVDTSSGTGLVHSAPGCGPEDYEVGMKYGLHPFNRLNERGEFENMGKYTGMTAKKDDKKFIEILKESGCLLAVTPVEHEYPHCWRCHNQVIFRTTEQWFMKTEDLRKEILKFNNSVKWIPEESNNSFKLWIENLKDNSITRQRFWGCPVPIWECEECDHIEVIGSAKELLEKAATKIPDDLHKPYIDEVKLKCKCGKKMARIPDVLDVWIDSGTASWSCLEYPHREDYMNSLYPADLVLEATEQTRLWFTMLQICSAIAFGKTSYKNVYTHGMILDYQGIKMSKSLGNIISPYEIVDKYGADVLRYYMCQTSAGKNICFSWDAVKLKQRNLNVLWNLQNYLIDLAGQIKGTATAEKGIEERYINSKLNSTIKKVEEKFEMYRLDETIEDIESLFLELSRTYIQMTRDKTALGAEHEKNLVFFTVKECLLGVLKMFSLICPFICEEIYKNLKEIFKTKEESIHLFSWPAHNPALIDEPLEKHMEGAQDIMQAVLAAREKASIGLRWPIKEVLVHTQDPFIEECVKETEEIIKQQVNAKTISINKEIKVEYEIKINYKHAGERFGRDLPKIIAKLSEYNGNETYEHIKKKGKFTIKTAEKEYELAPADVVFEKRAPAELKTAEFSRGTVFIDTERTKELETEGYARELMRRIQQMRKDRGLEKKDAIKIHIKTDFSGIDLYSEHIQDKCGAKGITISDADSDMEFSGEADIKGKKFKVYFDKD
jgi:isoleucyl-tRNA synthetase